MTAGTDLLSREDIFTAVMSQPDGALAQTVRDVLVPQYLARHYGKRDTLVAWASGWTLSRPAGLASQEGVTERTIEKWVGQFLDWAEERLNGGAELDRDEAVLESICAMTHGRSHSTGPISPEPLRANTCLGCALRAG